MKIPRVTDFDPDAKVPVLKSSLDNMPSIEKRKPLDQEVVRSPSPQSISNQQYKKTTVKSEQTNNNPATGIRDVRPVLPVPPKRVMKQRWPVDIYHDQYESLQRLALEDRMQGGVGSMSAMVREALDKLIKEKNDLKK
jgi:hypothetical protein